jgi:Xaa-Pro aminopeptidase
MSKPRLARLRRGLRERGLDGLVVSLPAHRRYLAGYTPPDAQPGESSGWLYVTAADAVLITDFRYELTARAQARWCEVRIHRRGLAKEVARLAAEGGVGRLGFEAEALLVAERDVLARELGPGVELEATQGLVAGLRRRKDAAEAAAVAAALELMEGVLEGVLAGELAGASERQLARRIAAGIEEAGGEGPAFEPIVASGPNAAEPHAEPTGRIIAEGEPVLFDVGARLDGYCSDISRTVVAGGLERADARFREVYPVVRRAQLAAIAGLRPGLSGAEADELGREVIRRAGYGERFGHSLGHGVGLATHEAPSLGPRSQDVLAEGMICTVEPGVYLPGWGGVRLEEMVQITAQGCRVLNRLDRFYRLD